MSTQHTNKNKNGKQLKATEKNPSHTWTKHCPQCFRTSLREVAYRGIAFQWSLPSFH